MGNMQIKDVTRKTGKPASTDLVLVDQLQPDGSYVTRSATMSQVVTAISSVIDADGSDYDTVNLDYTTIPVSYADVNGTAKAITMPSDGALYATSQGKLDDFYVKYPGYYSYQRIASTYIPGWSSNYHLDFPRGTQFYSLGTSTTIAAYLKVASKYAGTYIDEVPGFYCAKDKTVAGNIKTDEWESGGVANVFCWGEVAAGQSTLSVCARNDSSSNVYSRVTGTKISRSCKYFDAAGKEYGDKDVYKAVTLTKKTPVITPGSTQLVAKFPVFVVPSTLPYDATGIFEYDVYLQDWFRVAFYSLDALRG